jgi:uncharacterized membrane protein YcaP (DUF421 family)
MTVLSSYLAFKSRRARLVLQGEPLIVVQDGKPIDRNLREERLTLDDIMEEARSNEIESLDEIKFAVVEAGGAMSFIKK